MGPAPVDWLLLQNPSPAQKAIEESSKKLKKVMASDGEPTQQAAAGKTKSWQVPFQTYFSLYWRMPFKRKILSIAQISGPGKGISKQNAVMKGL